MHPGKAHRRFPRKLTGRSRIGSPSDSRKRSLAVPEKSHLSARCAAFRLPYGCSFILKPTTPGSSVADTSNPHDFASEIIGAFSRSASPTIHAVPRERA